MDFRFILNVETVRVQPLVTNKEAYQREHRGVELEPLGGLVLALIEIENTGEKWFSVNVGRLL